MLTANTVSASPEATAAARQFMEKFTATLRPLDIAANRAWWDANITGKDDDFKRKEDAQNKIDAFLSDKKAFAELKDIKERRRHRRRRSSNGPSMSFTSPAWKNKSIPSCCAK